MTDRQRKELVNAARAYERIVAERRATFVRAVGHKRDGREAEWAAERDTYHESKGRAREAERLVAERIYGDHDFVRVDDVVYMAYSTGTLLRIPLGDIPDLAKGEADDKQALVRRLEELMTRWGERRNAMCGTPGQNLEVMDAIWTCVEELDEAILSLRESTATRRLAAPRREDDR